MPEHRVQVNVAMCPRGATGRVSSVVIVTLRQVGQVMLIVIMMLLAGADTVVGP